MNSLYPWLTSYWQQWQHNLANQRFPAATLLVSPKGLGAEQLVDRLSGALMCSHQPIEACVFCHSCDLMKSGSHPDFHRIFPEKEGKSITVDQIRQCNKLAQESAQLSGARVIIIEPADAMNESAANALLKTLESPGKNCFFILVASRINHLLPTITSRCQKTLLTSPSSLDISQWLSSQTSQVIPAYVAHLNQNSPLNTLAFVNSGELDKYQAFEKSFLDVFANSNADVSAWAKQIANEPAKHLAWLWTILTDTQKVQFGLTQDDFVPVSFSLAKQISYPVLFQQTNALIRLMEKLTTFSGLNCELLAMNWLFDFNNEELCS
ncbi:DNA polymerase III subunit delta' [Vibrio aestuarianus]|uniref:DNA polymerase III subunit delta' n=1 Tax=Vibrio aestuarianus TaxID=28171 RepID=UPI00237C6609|nr:DNA polymerase III subunit delta' [Vibrio aestuarianus]MDE1331177.1 DNA polymerase III subunit delta' [Vibrio aestuarianus]